MTTKVLAALTVFLSFLMTSPLVALAQEAGTPATSPAGPGPAGQPVPELMYFTLGAGLFVAILMMLMFLSRRSNRAAASRVFGSDDRRD